MLKPSTTEESLTTSKPSQAARYILEDALKLAKREQITLFNAISRIGHASTNYGATAEARTLARSLGLMD